MTKQFDGNTGKYVAGESATAWRDGERVDPSDCFPWL